MLPEIDQALNKDIRTIQENGLRNLLSYLNAKSPYYKELFLSNGIDINSIHTLSDLERIPPTTKDDLQLRNWDFLCVNRNQIAEYCTTSGTLGNPVTIALTANDLDRLAYNEHQSFLTAGASSDDIFQFMLSLDRQFMAGIAYYSGVRRLGAGLVRVGPGNAAMQLDAINRFQPTILIAVPSFLISVIKTAKEKNINLNKTSVKKVICIGENIRDTDFAFNTLGKRIRDDWNIELYSTYASTEKQTAFTECSHGTGGHHIPELIIYEVLDENNKMVEPGLAGELVITTLAVEGMPLLRYRTGDVCSYHIEPCQCGRMTSRLSPIIGRRKHMIKYNGTTLYPQTIYNVLNIQEDIEDYAIVVTKNELGTDNLELVIAGDEKSLQQNLSKLLQSALRIAPAIRFTALAEVQQLQMRNAGRKPNKLIDLRS
ncbi:MAG: phenylacetate--CoA ligase family protein [Bacteroidetes bacterium]|nr:MAG: phenylacetate--CoA ligase family protein [Bacteroidota bacterium]